MEHPVIKLKRKAKGTDCIKLSDHGRTEVHPKSNHALITWDIIGHEISAFRLRDVSGHYPFVEPLPTDFRPEITLTLKETSLIYDWVYGIDWIDPHGGEHHSDPKISINPRPNIIFIVIQIILTVLSSFLGYFSLRFLLKKLKK